MFFVVIVSAKLLSIKPKSKFLGRKFFREGSQIPLIFNMLHIVKMQVFHSTDNQRVTRMAKQLHYNTLNICALHRHPIPFYCFARKLHYVEQT